jgi:hypothetical protein
MKFLKSDSSLIEISTIIELLSLHLFEGKKKRKGELVV